MRYLTDSYLTTNTNCVEPDDVQVVHLSKRGITAFAGSAKGPKDSETVVVLPSACLLNFGQNGLDHNSAEILWSKLKCFSLKHLKRFYVYSPFLISVQLYVCS